MKNILTAITIAITILLSASIVSAKTPDKNTAQPDRQEWEGELVLFFDPIDDIIKEYSLKVGKDQVMLYITKKTEIIGLKTEEIDGKRFVDWQIGSSYRYRVKGEGKMGMSWIEVRSIELVKSSDVK